MEGTKHTPVPSLSSASFSSQFTLKTLAENTAVHDGYNCLCHNPRSEDVARWANTAHSSAGVHEQMKGVLAIVMLSLFIHQLAKYLFSGFKY